MKFLTVLLRAILDLPYDSCFLLKSATYVFQGFWGVFIEKVIAQVADASGRSSLATSDS